MSKECQYCREDNIDSAVICANCKEPFENVIGSIKPNINSFPILTMIHMNSGKKIKITGNCILGRSGTVEPEFFTDDNRFVSEHHCKITLENSEYKIEHIGKNPTKVNDDSLSKGIRKILRNGDYLTIADRKFEIAIIKESVNEEVANSVTEQETVVSENTCLPIEEKFIITCPVCGFDYEVKSIDDKIKECEHCDDYDKTEISKINAKVKHAN